MLFVSARGAGVSGTLCSSMPGLEGSQSLRRASSIRRTFTAVKRKNICLQVKFTVVSYNTIHPNYYYLLVVIYNSSQVHKYLRPG